MAGDSRAVTSMSEGNESKSSAGSSEREEKRMRIRAPKEL